HQAAARDAHDGLERSRFVQAPSQRTRVAVELVPRHRKDFLWPRRARVVGRRSSHRCFLACQRAANRDFTCTSIFSTSALTSASRAPSRERTTILVLGPSFSSKNG